MTEILAPVLSIAAVGLVPGLQSRDKETSLYDDTRRSDEDEPWR